MTLVSSNDIISIKIDNKKVKNHKKISKQKWSRQGAGREPEERRKGAGREEKGSRKEAGREKEGSRKGAVREREVGMGKHEGSRKGV